MVDALTPDERTSVIGQARGMLAERPRLRGRFRDHAGRCCLIGAVVMAYENVFGEKVFVIEHVEGEDVWVVGEMGADLMGLLFDIHDAMPEIDCEAEFLPDPEDALTALVQYSDEEATTDAQIDALLAQAAGEVAA